MKISRVARWSGSILAPSTRPNLARVQNVHNRRFQSSVVAVQQHIPDNANIPFSRQRIVKENYDEKYEAIYRNLSKLPSPPPTAALASSKLSALHARLSLPQRLPVQTLARCLVHPSADPDQRFNNSSLAVLGCDLLGYYTSELILCNYPRLPMEIVYAATKAYVGPAAAGVIVGEWGVESAAIPGGEVDPGLLQFLRVIPGNADVHADGKLYKENEGKRQSRVFKPTNSLASIAESYFGPLDIAERPDLANEAQNQQREASRVTLQEASLSFLQALMGALYLHAGRDATKAFFGQHIRSRKLDVSRMFYFEQPTRDLSRLCAREGFEPPVARIISETGRRSRHPVFVVGVFSGREKLGEGAGASLDEARIRAAIASLKGWYLYSPMKVAVPSDVEGKEDAAWEPVLVDGGEVIV